MTTIKELHWQIEIPKEGLDGKTIKRLEGAGVFQVKTFDALAGDKAVGMEDVNMCESDETSIRLPKAKLNTVNAILKHETKFIPMDRPDAILPVFISKFNSPKGWYVSESEEGVKKKKKVIKADHDGSTSRLEPLQISSAIAAVEAKRNGVIHYAMGGGKSFMISRITQAYPSLRPALVTSAASGDTQQIAKTLSITNPHEKVYLAGATSGKLTSNERKLLFTKNIIEATIIVGTHALISKIEDHPEALHAKLIITDEVHELATICRLGGLLKTKPVVSFGFTGTWGMGWSRVDRILDACYSTSKSAVLTRVTHQEVQTTGRVVPMEIISHTFDRPSHPHHGTQKGSLFQVLVEQHNGRNQWLAGVIAKVWRDNLKDERGGILAFATTIGHAQEVHAYLAEIGIDAVLFNAQLANGYKTQILQDMTAGKCRIVISTNSLSRGIDMDTIYDVFDLTGGGQIPFAIQKSGRAVRPDGTDKCGRIHLVEETSPSLLANIYKKKVEEIEKYYGIKSKHE